MTKSKNNKSEDKSPSIKFEQLMEKFQFHNDSVQYHAHIAQFIADEIREKYPQQAKATGYFTEKFFEEEKTKARSDEQADAGEVDEQASESAAALH